MPFDGKDVDVPVMTNSAALKKDDDLKLAAYDDKANDRLSKT